MNITKGLQNYAARRGIVLELYNDGDRDRVLFWDINNDNEWLCSYEVQEVRNVDGFYEESLYFHGNILLSEEEIKKLPHYLINNDKKLKEVITFLGSTLK